MPSHNIKDLAISSAYTGVSVGLINYLVLPMLMSGKKAQFLAPALYAGAAAGLVGYLRPQADLGTQSLMVGGVMTGECVLFSKGGQITGCLRQGMIAAAADFAGKTYIVPILKQQLNYESSKK